VRRAINILRLGSGLILLAYVVTHLATHAVGLVSLGALQDVNGVFLGIWRSPPLYWVVPACLLVHVVLALVGVCGRRTLRSTRGQAAQLVLGLLIPLLLLPHIAATRGMLVVHGVTIGYRHLFLSGLGSTLALTWSIVALVWSHACLGMHLLLRLKTWYPRAAPLLHAGVLLLPVLACLGTLNGGRDAVRAAHNPEWLAKAFADTPGPTTIDAETREMATSWIQIYLGAVGLALLGRAGARVWRRQQRPIQIHYAGGRTARVPAGTTVLEASWIAGVSHASVCGGKGRCSTCRVRVIAGGDALPEPTPQEQRVLQRIGAPPNVRLGCQLKPKASLHVVPVLGTATPADGFARPRHVAGVEQEVAVMFADLRGFTGLAEKKLPYDVVYILNQYFEHMGEAICANGGVIDKFIGDGIMAIFGIGRSSREGTRAALRATLAMAEGLAVLNERLAAELPDPLRMGIGLHSGPAIIGHVGYRTNTSLTAIGDTTNTASRLEAMTKELNCELVVSQNVIEGSGWAFTALPTEIVRVRGKDEPLHVHPFRKIADLRLGAATPAEFGSAAEL